MPKFDINKLFFLRSYNNLKKKSLIDNISKSQEKISNIKFLIKKNSLNNLFFPKNSDFDIIVSNILISKIGINHLRKELILASNKKKILYPLPDLWIKSLEEDGYKLNKFGCRLMFIFFIIKYFLFGIWFNLKINFLLLKNIFKKEIKNFSFFFNVEKNYFPDLNGDSKYNLFSFYEKNIMKNKIDNILLSSNKEKYSYSKKYNFYETCYPILIKLNFSEYLNFQFKSILILFASILSILVGNWWNLILLYEQPLRLICLIKTKEELPEDLIFTLSDLYYRPLWTYEMESKGTSIYLIWYSTNNQANYKKKKSEKFFYDWANVDWPTHIVWNKNQEDWLKNYLDNRKVKIISYGYQWLSDDKLNIINKNETYISIFPVTPFRSSYFSIINEDELELLRSDNVIRFLSDIIDLSKKFNCKLLLKNKRKISNKHCMRYSNFLRKNKDNFIFVNEYVSPLKLLNISKASINYPFTSTAYLSKNFNIPTCYYDITGKIENFCFDDKIQIINSKKNFSNWFSSLNL